MSSLHNLGIPVWILFTVTLAGALVLAIALTYLVERPSLKALRRWNRDRTVPKRDATADRPASV